MQTNTRCGACGSGPNVVTHHCECGQMAEYECPRCDAEFFLPINAIYERVCGPCHSVNVESSLKRRGDYTAPTPPVDRPAAALPLPKRFLCPECSIEYKGLGGQALTCAQCTEPLIELPGTMPLPTIADIYVRALPIYAQSHLCTRCGKSEEAHPVSDAANLMRQRPRVECWVFRPALWGNRAAALA